MKHEVIEHAERLAVFIDAENLVSWIKGGGVDVLMHELTAIGPPIVRRAYGKWDSSALSKLQSILNEAGFELVHTFHPRKGKNSVDIQLTVDVMEYAATVTDLPWFVLATGDSDFSPLFRRLRESGKQVIGIGPRSPLSESVKSSCNRFLYTDQAKYDTDPEAQQAVAADLDDATALLESTLRNLDVPANLATLKHRILLQNSAFNEKSFGYATFKDFVLSVDSIGVFHEGLVASAYFKDDPEAIVRAGQARKASAAAVVDTPPTIVAPVERYRRLLRSKKWRALPADKVVRVYEVVRALEDDDERSTGDLRDLVVEAGIEDATRTEVKKALDLMFKARLFEGGAIKSTSLPELTEDRLLEEIDRAMLRRLARAAKEAGVTLDPAEVVKLYLSKWDADQARAWLDEAAQEDDAFPEAEEG